MPLTLWVSAALVVLFAAAAFLTDMFFGVHTAVLLLGAATLAAAVVAVVQVTRL